MSSPSGDNLDPLGLAEIGYGIIGVRIRDVLDRSADSRLRTALLVRRVVASGYDADDCVNGETPLAYRCEIRALTRALRALRDPDDD